MSSAWLESDWPIDRQIGPPGVWSGARSEGACSVFSAYSVSSARVLSAVGDFSRADGVFKSLTINATGCRLALGGHLCESVCIGVLLPWDVVELQTSEFPFYLVDFLAV